MTTVTLEIDDKCVSGQKFLSFLENLGYVSIISPENKKKPNSRVEPKTYSAVDFLEEWTGAFAQLNDEDLDELRYNYLSEKYK
jgi:hypothetical protein